MTRRPDRLSDRPARHRRLLARPPRLLRRPAPSSRQASTRSPTFCGRCVSPHGDAYVMSIAPQTRGGPDTTEVLAFMAEMAAGRLPFTVIEGGGGPDA